MSDKLGFTALTRLLTLNNQVHDLENQLMTESVPTLPEAYALAMATSGANRIAQMQDEIAQGVRASLSTCWLGASDDLDF
ncbi:MAG: hypothetical protein BZY75_02970 [SAR202 cluster bacterium Io17-Chloro-G7]|nr:MAG: hypothetical protein BZY75_02970 [SAR202 cluster bacterium Io17-Chloro-G7]